MKSYRPSENNVEFKTVTLTFSEDTMDKLIDHVNSKQNKNMSIAIEELMKSERVSVVKSNRKHGSFPIKKTFTFTDTFYQKLKKSGNMSVYVDSKLQELL